jgi:predicted hydrocarbon binding protein
VKDLTHSHRWIKSLVQSLDENVDEETRAKILERCGRNCISQSMTAKAKKIKKNSKDLDEFLVKLSKNWKHLKLDGKEIYVEYEKCYCPLVRDYPEKLSVTFCNCSRGWLKELFESALEKPVEVKLEKSIKRGDEICRFRVLL